MRIVFMGTPEFAVPSLQALCESGHEVIAVYTQPDRPKGRGNKVIPSPVKVLALEKGIPVYQPARISRESVEELTQLGPDLYVTAAFGQILSQKLLDIPKFGCINVHASLLPKHRGSAPIAWAIMNGDTETGVTTMMTDRGIDTGDMLLKETVAISDADTCGELTETLSKVGASLLIRTLAELENGSLQRIPQNHDEMTYDPMLTKEMGIIDWNKPAHAVVRQIHGLNPWPCCTAQFSSDRIKLLKASVVNASGEAGTVIRSDAKQGLVIACGSGAVRINRLQPAGKNAMNDTDYLRGHQIPVGTSLKEEQNG